MKMSGLMAASVHGAVEKERRGKAVYEFPALHAGRAQFSRERRMMDCSI